MPPRKTQKAKRFHEHRFDKLRFSLYVLIRPEQRFIRLGIEELVIRAKEIDGEKQREEKQI